MKVLSCNTFRYKKDQSHLCRQGFVHTTQNDFFDVNRPLPGLTKSPDLNEQWNRVILGAILTVSHGVARQGTTYVHT
jgi:hypothetical protein